MAKRKKQSRSSSAAVNTQDVNTDALNAGTLESLRSDWSNEGHWDEVEEQAIDAQATDAIVALYVEAIDAIDDGDVINAIGQRALAFFEEWADDPDDVIAHAMGRVIEVNPRDTDWAFERLSVLHTGNENWSALLDLYDHRIAAETNDTVRATLLDEASQTAKDFAKNSERAIGYIEQLLPLRPTDARLFSSLEKLLEKAGRWQDLCRHLRARAEHLKPGEAFAAFSRVAQIELDEISAHADAISATEAAFALGAKHDRDPFYALLARIVGDDAAEAEPRNQALALLREASDSSKTARTLLENLDGNMEFVQGDQRVAIRIETAASLYAEGRYDDALEQLRGALDDAPENDAVHAALFSNAEASNAWTTLVQIYETRAQTMEPSPVRSMLFRTAANVQRKQVGNQDDAARLFEQAFVPDVLEQPALLTIANEMLEVERARQDGAGELRALGRLPGLTPSLPERERAFEHVAWHADKIGDKAAAIDGWREVLALNEHHAVAMRESIRLLEETERWEDLAAALRFRIDRSSPAQQRADLGQLGWVHFTQMNQTDSAITVFEELAERFGRVPDTLDAMVAFFASDPAYAERQVNTLDEARAQSVERATELSANLGRLLAEQNDFERASKFLGTALYLSPDNEASENALRALAQNENADAATRKNACNALVELARKREDWQGALAFSTATVDLAESDAERVQTWRSCVDFSKKAEAWDTGIGYVTSLFCAVPDDLEVEKDVVAFAANVEQGHWRARDCFAEAATKTSSAPRTIYLLQRAAQISEEHDDVASACRFYTDALKLRPTDEALLGDVVKHAANAGSDVIEVLSEVKASGAASLAHLNFLADLQRPTPDAAFADTLAAIFAADGQRWDTAMECMRVYEDGLRDQENTIAVAWDIVTKAIRRVRRGGEGLGPVRAALDEGFQALSRNVGQVPAAQAPAAQARFVEALEEAAGVSGPDRAIGYLELARKSALAVQDHAAEVRLLEASMRLPGDNRETVARLAELYRQQERWPELIRLKQSELANARGFEDKRRIRLELAELSGAFENDLRVDETLKQNLVDMPGDPSSIETLTAYYEKRNGYRPLVNVLLEQANMVEAEQSLGLALRAAEIAEKKLQDVDLAKKAFLTAAERGGSPTAFESLARIAVARGEFGDASRWIGRLETLEQAPEPWSSLMLSHELFQLARYGDVVRVLENCRKHNPNNEETLLMLADAYRSQEKWGALGEVLSQCAMVTEDQDRCVMFAREVATLYAREAGEPHKAIPALERAVSIGGEAVKDANALKFALANAYIASAQSDASAWDSASTLLSDMVTQLGRRRTPERAEANFLLAQVDAARSDWDAAFEHLDQAAKINSTDPRMPEAGAKWALAAGDFARAEKAYRKLLMIVRRNPEIADGRFASRVLFDMHDLAKKNDDEEKAQELFESALEASVQDADETVAFATFLNERSENDFARRVLERRTGFASDEESTARAWLLLAEYDAADDNSQAAWDHTIRALRLAPKDTSVHEKLRRYAREDAQFEQYETVLEELVANAKDNGDAAGQAFELLQLGQLFEARGDHDRAMNALTQAEKLPADHVAVLKTIARVARVKEDEVEQKRALKALLEISILNDEDRTEALHQLAAIELSDDDNVADGLGTVRAALNYTPDHAFFARHLKSAFERSGGDSAILTVYEMVARDSAEPSLLLDYLSLQADRSDASLLHIREAAMKARELNRQDIEQHFLEKAVERTSAEESRWAVLALAELHTQRDDAEQAMRWIEQALALEPDETARARAELDFAVSASERSGGERLALQLYQRRFAADATNREVWKPAIELATRLGEGDVVKEMADALLSQLDLPSARNEVRIALAKEWVKEGDDKVIDAIELLKAGLVERPDDHIVAHTLVEVYKACNYDEELTALLAQQLEVAKQNQQVEEVERLALELGAQMVQVEREKALDLYYRTLAYAPQSKPLHDAYLQTFDKRSDDVWQRLEVEEKRLPLLEGKAHQRAALGLVKEWTEAENTDRARAILEAACAQQPENEKLRSKLGDWYRDAEMWPQLGALLNQAAAGTEDPEKRETIFLDAAQVFVEQLGDHSGAATSLMGAWDTVPRIETLRLAVDQHVENGNEPAAEAIFGSALERELDALRTVQLMVVRAEFFARRGEVTRAVEDLNKAYELDPDTARPSLIAMQWRELEAAWESGQAPNDSLREKTMALVALQREDKNAQGASDLLQNWCERQPGDREALFELRAISEELKNWNGLIPACEQLIDISEEEALPELAASLEKAAYALEQPGLARAGLERAWERMPGHGEVRESLKKVYRDTEANAELGLLLKQEALELPESETKKKYEILVEVGSTLLKSARETGEDADRERYFSEALTSLETAFELDPKGTDLVVLLADAYIGVNELHKCRELLQAAIENHTRKRGPELSMLQFRMSQLARAAGDEEAEYAWLGASVDADKANAVATAELAYRAMDRGDHDTALNALRAITLSRTEGPMSRAWAFLYQAKIAHEKGETRRALLWARKAKQEDESLTEVDAFLASLGES